MTASFKGMGGHHSARATTVEWLTPPYIQQALGGWQRFDLDPCAPAVQPYPTARATYTRDDNGLIQVWQGRVWLNPPYGQHVIQKWLGRMAAHDNGIAMIFARTETDAFFRFVWERAAGLLFLRGRVNFHFPDGERAPKNCGAPVVLCAYGAEEMDVLASCALNGQFVPLRFVRGVLVAIALGTWRETIVSWLRQQRGPVALADLYLAFAGHPKARANPNWQAKIRQVLQQGPFQRVARGQWVAA